MSLLVDGGRIKHNDLERFLIEKGVGSDIRASYLKCFDKDDAGADREKFKRWAKSMDNGQDYGKAFKSDCHSIAEMILKEV